MDKPTAHIRRHLRASEPIAALLDEIERREQLLSKLRRWLPADLAKHCCQAAVSAGELTLFVDSPVWVDRFRFLCPELIGSDWITGLAAVETEVKTCKVRVLPPAHDSMAQLSRPESGRLGATQEPGNQKSGNQEPGNENGHLDDAGQSALSQALARLARTLGISSG
ncbi:MAG: DciA family protein [Lamprobacter sp.]|uniref:DciA family protein n=1 Tax=Lamprobacter sp. TaxID=3100796 RepID=UPI002B25F0A9|nr:DciA family protein [Lamprobacter sp.]MEA3640193.1 DciA family protein [Lamprobacter sp.]